MSETSAKRTPEVDSLGNVVPPGYAYYEKVIEPREGLEVAGAYLKWYDIFPGDNEITHEQRSATRDFISKEAGAKRLPLEGELGFVILHRAGSTLLLMVMTWRNTNEIWESIYHREAAAEGEYRAQTFESSHRATFCVWELGAVWHERNAWVRFIRSKRDEAAKLAYLNDTFSGRV